MEMIRIDHSDRTVILNEGGKVIKQIAGNIQLRQDSTYMYCDSAVILDNIEVHAFDSITIQQGDSLNVFSDTLNYTALDKQAVLRGNVVLEHGLQQLWTQALDYNLESRIARYLNGATLYDDSLQLSSKRGFYFVGEEKARFLDSVIVVHKDFTLAADSLQYLIAEKRAVFIGPTRILQGESDIYCESGYYNISQSYAEFSKNAQYADDKKQATADTIRYNNKTSEIEMIGNVRYREGDRVIRSRYLLYNEKTGDTYMRGKANYKDSLRNITSEEIYFNTITEALRTTGKSQVTEGSQELTAENIFFDSETNLGIATGNVVWIDTTSKYVILTDTAYYRKDIHYVKAFGSRRPVLKSEMDGDTLYLSSDTLVLNTVIDTSDLEAPDTTRIFNAYYDVKVFKSNLQAICDSLSFSTIDSMFHFYRNPIVWSDTSQFSADSISLKLKNERVDRFLLRRNGFIINRTNEIFFNQIKGKFITAQFENDEVRTILVEGNAESVYYATDDENAFIGVNKSICSEMLFIFEEKKMDTVKFLKDPKSKMSPMESTNHIALRLEGFRWVTASRPNSISDIYK